MLNYEILLAVLLILFFKIGLLNGTLYNLLNIYLMARLITEGIRLTIAYRSGDFSVLTLSELSLNNLGWEYWLINSIKTVFFIAILFYVLDRFVPFHTPKGMQRFIYLLMVGLPILSIILLWIPTSRVNWPQAIAMSLIVVVFIPLMGMQLRTQFKQFVILDLPLAQDSLIVSGGFSPLYNHHFFLNNQRYAADMILREYNTQAHELKDLRSFPSFGADIYAPMDGTVVTVETSMQDIGIGDPTINHPVGNHLVLDIGEGKFVLFAHLKQHSAKVNTGDKVNTGQILAKVGNTGNTTEPHLHIQVQNHKDFDQATKTYPMKFRQNENLVFTRANTLLKR